MLISVACHSNGSSIQTTRFISHTHIVEKAMMRINFIISEIILCIALSRAVCDDVETIDALLDCGADIKTPEAMPEAVRP